jgi:uncharacterized phage protein gp47/JayE
LQIASLARFSTSSGEDADSWGADFDFPRLPAKAATGSVTFSRFTPTAPAIISVGSIVQTSDGSQQYAVIADTNQTAYDPTQQAYVIAANVTSCTATVEAIIESSSGNAAAGAINTLGFSGVDSVTNPLAFENGADAESDADYHARFPVYIAGLGKGTRDAIASAIESLQQNIAFSIVENENFDGSPNPGYFYVVVDDGSGNPSSDFLASVFAAIDRVRALGAVIGVFGPTLVAATVAMTLEIADGYDKPTVAGQVQAALLAYISGLSIGIKLPYTRLSQIAYNTSPGITDVTNILLNGATTDLTATGKNVIRANTITVSTL